MRLYNTDGTATQNKLLLRSKNNYRIKTDVLTFLMENTYLFNKIKEYVTEEQSQQPPRDTAAKHR